MVTKLDNNMLLSDEMLGSLLLDHADLSPHESLMVLTSTGDQTGFEQIKDVLILQHSRIHMRTKGKGKGDRGKGKSHGSNRYGAVQSKVVCTSFSERFDLRWATGGNYS